VKASPLGRKLAEALGGAEVDRAGRVTVAEDCSVPGHPDVFVVGDLALFKQDGKPLPGLAPVAMQQGKYVAKVIDRRLRGKSPPTAFRYWDRGTMATIGRNRAVADVRWFRLSGFLAWLAWLALHIFYLIGFRNRLVVLVDWAWAYFGYRRGSRLITGQPLLPDIQEPEPPA
jgi:NADH dehydrogenase